MGKVLAITNRKGGTGKTMTSVSLGASLARQGKKVLVVDADSQHSATVSLGVRESDKLAFTLATIMQSVIKEQEIDPTEGIILHDEGISLMPSNNGLAGMEIVLAGVMGRETVLRQYIDEVRGLYDYILLDTAPTLDLLAINALAAADSVIIPVAPKFLDAKGLAVMEGVQEPELRIAPGRVPQTANIGEIGNAVIAGHRNFSFGSMFNRLGEVENGDIIGFQAMSGQQMAFEVFEILVIAPDNQIAFIQPQNESIITLYTCTPIRVATHRLLIRARKIEGGL